MNREIIIFINTVHFMLTIGAAIVVRRVMMYFLFFSKVIYYKKQSSINDISPVLFDNLLPSFREFHNSLFIEGSIFIDYALSVVGF